MQITVSYPEWNFKMTPREQEQELSGQDVFMLIHDSLFDPMFVPEGTRVSLGSTFKTSTGS